MKNVHHRHPNVAAWVLGIDQDSNEFFMLQGLQQDAYEAVKNGRNPEPTVRHRDVVGDWEEITNYFHRQSCKALQYTGGVPPDSTENDVQKVTKTLLVARVALGEPLFADGAYKKQNHLPSRLDRPELRYDSLVRRIS